MKYLFIALLMWIPDLHATELEYREGIHRSFQYEAQGAFDKSIEMMMPFFRKDPYDYFTNLRLGWLFYLKRQSSNAIMHYKQAIKKEPQSLEAHLGVINTLMIDERWSEIEHETKESLRLFPDQLLFIGPAIRSKIELGHFDSALNLVEEKQKIYPTDLTLFEQKLKAYRGLGQLENANSLISKIKCLYPTFSESK